MTDTDVAVRVPPCGVYFRKDMMVVPFLWEVLERGGDFEVNVSASMTGAYVDGVPEVRFIFSSDRAPGGLNGRLNAALSFASKTPPTSSRGASLTSLGVLIQAMLWSGIEIHNTYRPSETLANEFEHDLRSAILDIFEDECFAKVVMSFVPGGKKATLSVPA
jgi:hypothetical protein